MNSQPVELVILTEIVGKIDEGNKCDVYKAQVIGANKHQLVAFVKHLPPRAIFVECVAGLIGRSLGLSIPRPLLVRVQPYHLPALKLEVPTLFFGCEDVGYPSLQQYVLIDNVSAELKRWQFSSLAGCFDEWIVNADRHSGNILYSGTDKFTLIDHSHALPAAYGESDCTDPNSFLKIISPRPDDEIGIKRAVKKAHSDIRNILHLVEENWLEWTRASIYIDEARALEAIRFLNGRLNVLGQLVEEQLGQKQKDLYLNDKRR